MPSIFFWIERISNGYFRQCSTAEAEGDQTAVGMHVATTAVGDSVRRIVAVSDAKSMVDLYTSAVARHMKIRQRNANTLFPCVFTMGAVAAESSRGFEMEWESNEHDRSMSDATRHDVTTRLNKAVDIASKHVTRDRAREIREQPDARVLPQRRGYGTHSDFSLNGMRGGPGGRHCDKCERSTAPGSAAANDQQQASAGSTNDRGGTGTPGSDSGS